MTWYLADRVAIVGIGHARYSRARRSGRTALSHALEAAITACEAAGITPQQIDGFVTYRVQRHLGCRGATPTSNLVGIANDAMKAGLRVKVVG